jgi:RsiW-degrading membrane proteinase PrsW (M82 family)
MFLRVLALSLAPVVALFWFFYVRDKYQKEPTGLLLRAFVFGALGVGPAILLGYSFSWFMRLFLQPGTIAFLLVENFIVISLVEEAIKFYVVMSLTYRHCAFDEPYDAMVYAITASLGFAALENIMYVTAGGVPVALARMLLAVPAHALFGSFMGYYIGHARFSFGSERKFLFRALLIPVLLHGLYDALLSTQRPEFALLVIPLSVYMWWRALRQVRSANDRSPFRPQN